MQERSDEDLMAVAMTGDQKALGTLVARHHRPLLAYLYRLTSGDRPLAEDLVQETLLRVVRQRTYQPGRPFRPWLYAIATNLARDHFASAAARHATAGDAEPLLRRLPDGSRGPEEWALTREQGDEVRAALAGLGGEYRVVLLLRYYQEFSLQEIADTLRIPLGTVKSRLSVGGGRLRRALDPLRRGVT
ncbi:MAG: sigma-70 family RNA polymerase sigma factor [Candidatus Dormibacteraeota bacterium]|nr:sigma-70 family RNA polymerase sigma factor [Candidatus Dormibacteraeota bacterium]